MSTIQTKGLAGSRSIGPGGRSSITKRWQLTPFAKAMLEAAYEMSPSPTTAQREAIARQLHATPRQVQVWFQNKRQRSLATNSKATQELDHLPIVLPTPPTNAPSQPPSPPPDSPAPPPAEPTLALPLTATAELPSMRSAMRRVGTETSLSDLAEMAECVGGSIEHLTGGLQRTASFKDLAGSISRVSSFKDLGSMSRVGTIADFATLVGDGIALDS